LLSAVIITKSIRAVIFDLDGTLIDTAGEIATALERTFAELGLATLPKKAVEALIGRGVPSMVERALAQVNGTGHNLGQAVERFEAHYAQTVGTAAELFPGVRAGLEALGAADFALSVVTNKPRYFTQRLLERLGVDGFFGALVAGDDGIRRKPHGDMLVAACERMGSRPPDSLMIGDSDNDVVAARAAGCPVWCVPYGYNEGRPADTLACDRMVRDVEEAARLLLAGDQAGKT
jgi:phosphoglycolate phosphatase